MSSFASIQFGFADAHVERAEEPDLLLDGFVDHAALMTTAFRGTRFLFLGYKGSGKTAIVERARLLADATLFVTPATLQEFSYSDLKAFADTDGDAHARFATAWTWSLLLLLISSFERDEGARAAAPTEYRGIVAGLDALGMMPAPKLNQLLNRSTKKALKAGFPKIFELQIEKLSEVKELGLAEMVRVVRPAIETFRSQSSHIVFVDGLDEMLTGRLQFQSIAALIAAASALNEELRDARCPAKVIVLCRTDIFDRLPLAKKNTLRQDRAVELDWDRDQSDPRSSRLVQLVNVRANRTLSDPVDVFDQFLPPEVDGQEIVGYLLDHTRHTPRDVLQLMRALQHNAGGDHLTEHDVKSGVAAYSRNYFLPELRDELHGYVDSDQINEFVGLFTSLGTDEFDLATLRELKEQLGFEELKLNPLLRTLFECGGLGMVAPGDGPPRYTFKYRSRNAEMNLSRRLVIHRGAHKALDIEPKVAQ